MDFRVIKMCNIINKSKMLLKEIKTIKHSGKKLKQASQALSQTSIYTCSTELCKELMQRGVRQWRGSQEKSASWNWPGQRETSRGGEADGSLLEISNSRNTTSKVKLILCFSSLDSVQAVQAFLTSLRCICTKSMENITRPSLPIHKKKTRIFH